jgi:hypothetical protein
VSVPLYMYSFSFVPVDSVCAFICSYSIFLFMLFVPLFLLFQPAKVHSVCAFIFVVSAVQVHSFNLI